MKIRMIKSDFFRIHNKIDSKNVEINNDYSTFEIDYSELKKIKNQKIPYEILETKATKLKLFIKNYYLLIIGILLLFFMIYINTYRVDKIEFSEDTPINSSIETRINKALINLFCFKFSNIDYDKLTIRLQNEYLEYAYIGVCQKNNTIYVSLSKNEEIEIKQTAKGSVYSTTDAIVTDFYIFNGESNIYKNKFVKKGDLLISDNGSGTRGYILGTSYKKIVQEIPKKQEKIEYNNYNKFTRLTLFGYDFNFKRNENSNYISNETTKFNLFSLFQIKEIEECEKNAIIVENSLEAARKIAIDNINNEFRANQILSSERIDDIYERSYLETENSYKFVHIVKMTTSIGELVKEEKYEA